MALDIKSRKPLIIAGPCSAETREQTLSTMCALAATGKVDVLRAGVWKPRTKPGMFEGMGVEALPWLVEAREQTGLPIAVEVANARHVESALKFDIDILWLGARTTSNPFSTQEVAEALRGTEKPVLVKNPMSADLELWIGAVERLQKCDIKNIGLIHRGFSGYGVKEYRNSPMWHIPLEAKRRMPELPMFCDPSHICGNRVHLFDVAQQAADLDFNGVMMESHCSPDTAWSDASQQITPDALSAMLDRIQWRATESQSVAYQNSIDELRGMIDRLDNEVFDLLARRMLAADNIGRIKRENNVMILQSNRWNEVVARVQATATKHGLSAEFVATVLEAIHIESINHQNRVMREE